MPKIAEFPLARLVHLDQPRAREALTQQNAYRLKRHSEGAWSHTTICRALTRLRLRGPRRRFLPTNILQIHKQRAKRMIVESPVEKTPKIRVGECATLNITLLARTEEILLGPWICPRNLRTQLHWQHPPVCTCIHFFFLVFCRADRCFACGAVDPRYLNGQPARYAQLPPLWELHDQSEGLVRRMKK